MRDDDDPEFDNDGPWPRRLLHLPTMTSYKWKPGNKYKGRREPSYNAMSYTWGRWRLREARQMPEIGSLRIKGVPWEVPRIDPSHFSVAQFEDAIHQAVRNPPPVTAPKRLRRLKMALSKAPEFLWLDVACIDQRGTPEAKAEVGRQAKIFRGAKNAYVWLSHISYHDLVAIVLYLTGKSSYRLQHGILDTLDEATEWKERTQQMLETLSKLVSDPWFSSLWTLQEAVLCPSSIILAKNGQYVIPEGWFLFRLSTLVSCMRGIYINSKKALHLQNDTSDWQHTKSLISLIESSGLQSLFTMNPMAALTIARFRKTEIEVDRVYGIMQIFGDEFKVGEATTTQEKPRQYTLSELQDELGRLLLHRYPILSQIHTHLDPPPFGKGWRICARSAIPDFDLGSEFKIHDSEQTMIGAIVSRCRLTTTVLDGITWGFFRGKACRFDLLQQSWNRHYSSLESDHVCGELVPLKIALDSLPVIHDILPLYTNHRDARMGPKSELELARMISSHFQGRKLVVLLLGEQRYGDWIPLRKSEPAEDQFVGMILLKEVQQGTQYWQRIGICEWTSCRIKSSTYSDNLNKHIVLAQGGEWQDLHGVFG